MELGNTSNTHEISNSCSCQRITSQYTYLVNLKVAIWSKGAIWKVINYHNIYLEAHPSEDVPQQWWTFFFRTQLWKKCTFMEKKTVDRREAIIWIHSSKSWDPSLYSPKNRSKVLILPVVKPFWHDWIINSFNNKFQLFSMWTYYKIWQIWVPISLTYLFDVVIINRICIHWINNSWPQIQS
jgi:hypothetical protein